MKHGFRAQLVAILALLSWHAAAAEWQIAEPGWDYVFPADHQRHAGFKTEWWYFTGNLRSGDSREFGFELTFFRQGVRQHRDPGLSRWVVDDLKFAHFAVSDLGRKAFSFTQRMSRGAFGEAGFSDGERVAWLPGMELRLKSDGTFALRAEDERMSIDLHLVPETGPVIHGENGVSRKADGRGRTSHYYSITRLQTRGTLVSNGHRAEVEGLTWFDHEWATNQLSPDQSGWDWFSIQFEDGSDLMLYRLRMQAGGVDPNSSGTFISPDGRTTHLRASDFRLEPVKRWASKATGALYPVEWRLEIPRLELELEITTPLPQQELALKPVSYWEGAIRARGTRAGEPVSAEGYMELTGYSGRIVGVTEGL